MTLASTTHPPGVYELYSFRAVDVNGINGNWTPSNSSAVTITNIDCSGINQSSSLNVTQTATGIDLNSDGALTAGEAIRYDITVTNSGNTTITGLDFLSIFQPGGSKTFSISDLSKYLPSQNNRGDGFIIPGGQAAFTQVHTITYDDSSAGQLYSSLQVTGYPACGGITQSQIYTLVNNVVTSTLINLTALDFYNLTTGSSTNTKVLPSQTVTFTAVMNDTTVNSPTLSINWYSGATTTTAAINLYERIQPNLKIAGNNYNAWNYSWTVSPGLVSQLQNNMDLPLAV